MRSDLAELRIIHGKGTGALRERVGEMLRKDTRVTTCATGRLERGWCRRHHWGSRELQRSGAALIPDDVVERVREEADIVQIIGEHVTLKRMGTDYRGPCPFHQGTHPNFSVSPKKHMYYCFVCHEGGDVFTFLSKRLGLDWPRRGPSGGQKSGIEIREVEAQRSGPDPREPLWEVTATAAEYFRRMLWDDEGGHAGARLSGVARD